MVTRCPIKKREIDRRYREKHRQIVNERIAKRRVQRNKEVRRWVRDYLLHNPCVDCGETDIVVLEFDHRGEKLFSIGASNNKSKSLAAVVAEVAKCDVRCANCHRRKTYKEAGYRHKHRPEEDVSE